MEYMILIHQENTAAMGPDAPDFEAQMADWMIYNQRLIDGGHWVAGASLQPVVTATTVRKTNGAATTTTDGPFAETKEQFGGFYLVKAADLDEALELAKGIPLADAAIEVRPIAFRPDAG